jgi:uncharacterized membrane protein
MGIVRLPMKYVNILHILVIGALLVYIGYFQTKSPKPIYYALGLSGLAIILFVPFPTLEFTNLRNILNIAHYILFIPGFITLAYFGLQNKLTKETYRALGFVGVFIIIYHLYKLITRLM